MNEWMIHIHIFCVTDWALCRKCKVTILEHIVSHNLLLVKGKAVPLKAWSGPEVSRKLRFPDFLKTAQDGGKVVSLMHMPHLTLGNSPGTHFCYWLSGPQGHSAIRRIMSIKNSNDQICELFSWFIDPLCVTCSRHVQDTMIGKNPFV
jgi:hypothetical protein